MSTDTLAHTNAAAKLLEQVVVKGDLSKLSENDRVLYYRAVCESLNLNPLTQPFGYVEFSEKVGDTWAKRLTLYARKDCTEQIRKQQRVSITKVEPKPLDGGLYSVTASAVDGYGRTDSSIGIVFIEGIKGTALANALMRAETKAKRRVTLSLCGLGLIDESEIEDIPGATIPHAQIDAATGEITGGQHEIDQREVVLIHIRELGDSLGLKAEERSALWKAHVGQSVETAELGRLQALEALLVAKEKKK